MLLVDRPNVDETTRREHRAEIVKHLRDPSPRAVFSIDDAAATVSRGYSLGIELHWNPQDGTPPPYDTLVKRGVIPTPKSQYAVPADARPAPATSQAWEDHVSVACDTATALWERRWPLYLRVGVPRALAGLSALDRRIVWLCGRWGQSFRGVGEVVGLSDKPVRCHYDRAMDAIVDAVWDEDGAPRYGDLQEREN